MTEPPPSVQEKEPIKPELFTKEYLGKSLYTLLDMLVLSRIPKTLSATEKAVLIRHILDLTNGKKENYTANELLIFMQRSGFPDPIKCIKLMNIELNSDDDISCKNTLNI